MAVSLLLIRDELEAIYYIRAILDFIMLAPYLLYDNKTLLYIDHTLYKFDNTKIIFENYCLIDAKLFQPNFNI